jgi:serine/threonine-protein kinase
VKTVNLERWNKLKVTLADAIAVDPARRAGFLEDSGLEPDDIVEIESLLQNEVEARDFLSIPASGFAADFFPTNENGSDLRVIGAYEIVDELGAGGMGAVFLGERRDGKFAQRVAIKMIRREFNTEAIRKNFDREKNILAALSHSSIARLLDAGTTDDGVPYLAMEYVEGVRVDSFCYENNLDLKARLKLFNKICEAVAFAHRNLIVHRDIKPSNILVTADGTPKLARLRYLEDPRR